MLNSIIFSKKHEIEDIRRFTLIKKIITGNCQFIQEYISHLL